MPSLSPLELVTVAVIALVVFGPNKLPEFARNIGQFLAQMRRISDDLRSEFSSGMSDFAVDDEPEDDEPPPQRAAPEDDEPWSERAAPEDDEPWSERAAPEDDEPWSERAHLGDPAEDDGKTEGATNR